MKYLVLLALVISFSASSQECVVKRSQDPYTKEVRITTGFMDLDDARVSIMVTKPEIDFLFIIRNHCYDDASTAVVLFQGVKLKVNMKNGGPDNCDGIFHFTFKNIPGTPSALQNLSTRTISSVKFKDNTGKETEITFSPEQAKLFLDYSACMLKEAKALLQ